MIHTAHVDTYSACGMFLSGKPRKLLFTSKQLKITVKLVCYSGSLWAITVILLNMAHNTHTKATGPSQLGNITEMEF